MLKYSTQQSVTVTLRCLKIRTIWYHKITEKFVLKETLKIIQFQPLAMGTDAIH